MHHVVTVQRARLGLVDGALAQLDVPDEVPRSGGQHAEADHAVLGAGVERVPRDLLGDKARIRFVLVERADHPVAVGPRVLAQLVLVVAVRLAVVHDVEPTPRLPFAEAR